MPHQDALRDQLTNMANSMKENYQKMKKDMLDTDGPVAPTVFMDAIAASVAIVKQIRKLEKQARPLKSIFSSRRLSRRVG